MSRNQNGASSQAPSSIISLPRRQPSQRERLQMLLPYTKSIAIVSRLVIDDTALNTDWSCNGDIDKKGNAMAQAPPNIKDDVTELVHVFSLGGSVS